MRPIRFRFRILRMMIAVAIGTVLVVTVARARERSNRLHTLALARHEAALKVYTGALSLYPSEITLFDLYTQSRRLMEAESDLWDPSTAAKAHLGRWKMISRSGPPCFFGPCSGEEFKRLDLIVKEAEYWVAKYD
jgi:hypothetical protein